MLINLSRKVTQALGAEDKIASLNWFTCQYLWVRLIYRYSTTHNGDELQVYHGISLCGQKQCKQDQFHERLKLIEAWGMEPPSHGKTDQVTA
jgi:hypothetical protein